MSITGERIKKRRKELGIGAEMLAKHLGVSRSTIFRYENGDIEKVPANLISDIAKLLKTSEAYLMGWKDNLPVQNTPKIIQYYEMLNDMGKHEATKRVKELTELSRYVSEDSDYVNAAHPIEGASEEDKQFDEDIMNDDDF